MGANPYWNGNKDTHGISLDTNWFFVFKYIYTKKE